MTTADQAPVLRLKAGVAWQRVDKEVVVLDLASSSYLAVNDTGAVLWALVAAGATEPALVDTLTARVTVDADRARADVRTFVTQLQALGLVEES